MRTAFERKWLALASLAAAWIIGAAFLASAGAFSIDETIYSIMIERFATTGSLTIPNGYAGHPSESLLVRFLVPGPNGLVPQYPSGYAVLAAPFFLVGGLQGVVVLNAISSVLTLIVTFHLVKTLFEDRDLALNAALMLGFSCFLTEYALGIWPHAVSVLFVTTAAYCAVLSLQSDQHRNWLFTALSGLVIALGATIRVDVIIAAPVLAIWLFGSARRPIVSTGAFALATVFGLAASAWMNHVKFGTWMPISYGRNVGAAHLSAYLPLLPAGVASAAGAVAFAAPSVRHFLLGRRGVLLSAGMLALLFVLPWTRDISTRVFHGLYFLLFDLQAQPEIDSFTGAQRLDGGPVLLYGLLKKSLFQSLPFLGFAILPLAGLFRAERRSAMALCWLFPLVWFIPFGYFAWFGGMASNMRYFLPTLPFLSILAAIAWREICAQAPGRNSWTVAGIVAMLTIGLIVGRPWSANLKASLFAGHLVVPSVLFLTAAATALFWISAPRIRPTLRYTAILLFVSSSGWAAYTSLIFDPIFSEIRRHAIEASTRIYSKIEPNAHVVALLPEKFLFQLQRKHATLAVYFGDQVPIDFALIESALAEGRPVYVDRPEIVTAIQSAPDGKQFTITPVSEAPKSLYIVTPSRK